MGCCASVPSSPSSPYPTAATTSSSRAINTSQPASHTAIPRPSTTHTNNSSQAPQPPALRERFNRPLRPHVWTSRSKRWTRRALDREREEFFDTRVTGRPEIWLTLRTALEVLWAGDESDEGGIATAQTILDAADVTLPTGDLANGGAYDAFGALYSLPEWVVSDPLNLTLDDDGGEAEEILVKDDPEVVDEEEEATRRREEKGKAVLAAADVISVKARLSDRGGADVTVQVGKGDSVRLLTKRIFEESGLPPSKRIKIVYMGKLLDENKPLCLQGWKNDHIINAMVFD